MKGDFTRFTFKPRKHYRSVLMQQGRVQLDADWNEQTLIQAHFLQSQAFDMIGVYGAAKDKAGNGYQERDSFKLTSLGSDLAIAPGSIYVNGILCELESGTAFSATPTVDNKLQVKTLIVDNRQLEVGQWLEVLDDSDNNDESSDKLVQIDRITDQQELLLIDKEKKVVRATQLRRAISFKTQPDFPQPPQITEKGWYLVYLDVWQRHISAIEDAEIREVALNAPDTTTRIKTVWQVKLYKLKDAISQWQTEFQKITTKRKAYLTANDVKNSNSQIASNQLYRVEIHQPGKGKEATFKWSQDNGTTVFAVSKIESNQITVKNLGRDTSESFNVGQWVEMIDDIRELQGKRGTLVRLTANTSGKKLVFDPATIVGDAINTENFPKENNPKVRRWDGVSSSAAIATLNNEIEVKFKADSEYKTGDYWLIPIRTVKVNGHNILWEFDGTGEPLAQLPQGIKHQYCPLALVNFDGEFSEIEADKDLRETFPPLSRTLDRAGGTITGELTVNKSAFLATNDGNVNIGSENHQANLEVAGDIKIAGNRFRNAQNKAIINTVDDNILQLNPESEYSAIALYKPVEIIDGGLTIGESSLSEGNLIVTKNAFLAINSGNVNIGSQNHQANLEVAGNVKIAGDRLINAQNKAIINTVDDNLLQLNPESEYSAIALYKSVTINDGGLTIGESSLSEGNLIVTKNAFLATDNGNVGIGTQNPTAKLEVIGNIKSEKINIGDTPLLNLDIPDHNKLYVDGNAYVNGQIYVQDVYITGSGFKNVENKKIVDTSDTDYLKVNPESVYQAINLYKQVEIIDGGLIIGESSLTQNEFKVTRSTFLATNDGNVNIGSETHQANLEVAGNIKIAGDKLINAQNKAIINTVDDNILQLNPESEYSAIALYKQVEIIDGGLTIGESSLSSGNLVVNKNAFLATDEGKVGIGTQNPQVKLEVTGDIKADKINIGGTPPENLEIPVNTKLYVDGDIYLTGKIYPQDDNTPDRTLTSANELKVAQIFATPDGNTGVGTQNPTAKLEVAGDFKIAGDRLKNAQNKAIINTIDDNLLKINPDSEYSAIALYKPVAISNGGLSIGELTQTPPGNLNVTQSAFLATTGGNVNIGSQNHQANLKVAGIVNIGRTPANNIINTRNLKLSVEGDTYISGDISAQQYFQVSSQEMKENITELSIHDGLQILESLNPVKFNYRNDRNKRLYAGFISEETNDMFTTADKKMINDAGIVAILTKVVKEYVESNSMLHQVIQTQQQEMSNLRERIKILEEQQKKQSLFPW